MHRIFSFVLVLAIPWGSALATTLSVTYASFSASGFDEPESFLVNATAIGFQSVTVVPTYYCEHKDEIITEHTPNIQSIERVLFLCSQEEIDVIYRPHIDPVKYLWGYDKFTSENASWRVGIGWRGFLDISPSASRYFEIVLLPVLRSVKRIMDSDISREWMFRLDLGAELMDSEIRHGLEWAELAHKAREFLVRNGIRDRVRLSHNFTHHTLIDEDYLARMTSEDRVGLREYVESLDEVSMSTYGSLRAQTGESTKRETVAASIREQLERFRVTFLGEGLKVTNYQRIPVHIGEFGVGVGGLLHPNYWEGGEIDRDEQALGYEGLISFLTALLPTSTLQATLWTIGSSYDILGFEHVRYSNPRAINAIVRYLRE